MININNVSKTYRGKISSTINPENIMEKEKENTVIAERKMLYYHFDGNEWNQKWEEKLEAGVFVYSDITQRLEEIRQQIREGKVSPLAYHIHRRFSGSTSIFSGQSAKIDLLSSYTGIAKRHIKKHLEPEYFNQLDEKTLEKYAEIFEISAEELKSI